MSTSPSAGAAACGLALLLAGCASTRLDAQWSDPQFEGRSLRGARILVACESSELVVRQLCQDQLSNELTSRGATPLVAQAAQDTPPAPRGAYSEAARSAGARAALIVQLSVIEQRRDSPVSIGLGGFGIGSGGVGGGVGVSMPVGGGRTVVSYTANGRLADADTGRLMWTARASAAPSNQPAQQLEELARVVVGGAEKAGFF